MSNIICIAGENDKKKKGGGTNAVLALMKDLGDFQEKVQTCMDAQDLEDRRSKLELFYDKLDEMAEVLLAMAADGIKSKRDVKVVEEEVDETDAIEDTEEIENPLAKMLDAKPQGSSIGRIQMVNAPSIPRLPR